MKRPRDMSRAQFNAALRRRGWRKVLCWIDLNNGTAIGMIMTGGRFNLRASLAKAIYESEQGAGRGAHNIGA
jgi:hypothetical protein